MTGLEKCIFWYLRFQMAQRDPRIPSDMVAEYYKNFSAEADAIETILLEDE